MQGICDNCPRILEGIVKYILVVLTTIALLLQACERFGIPKDTKNQEIKKSLEALSEAFNQQDINEFSSFWSQDAYYINLSTEESVVGNDNIANYFNKEFVIEGKGYLTMRLSNISFPSKDVAQARGVAEIEQLDIHKKIAFDSQFVNEGGKWVIQIFSVNELKSPISHFDQLKALDWLTGNWADDDENIDVTYQFEWDKDKNFLTQHFILSILGYEELRGMQIIGWDPEENMIRSWIFDSDGGFGQSVWYEEDNSWYANVTFTMPKGGRATATHVVTKIDDNTFTFASVARDVNGILLPNIGPFKVIRKK